MRGVVLYSRRALSRLGVQARIAVVSALLFALLVVGRVHGSSIAFLAGIWSPDKVEDHYLAAPVLRDMEPQKAEAWRARLLAKPSWIRIDEFAQVTPWALAQASHEPPFPVINRNMGNGENMLLVWSMPVLHLSALVRPISWGYLLFGTQVGLAWFWWFPLFFCFVSLTALLQILLPNQSFIGIFAALWYCSSAYVVCWSLWPAYYTAFGACSLICAYYLLKAGNHRRRFAWGTLLGLSFAGFALLLYPPWQVPLGLTLLCLFMTLCVRDGLLVRWRSSLGAATLGLTVAALIMGSFYVSTAEALHALANTVYPGARRLLGGDCSVARLAGGFFNYETINATGGPLNPSEAAGFFLLFPSAIIAGAVSKRVRSRLGVVGWSLAALAVFFTYFCVTPIPEWLASATLMSRVQGFRAQIALGLLSVLLCALLLDAASRCPWRDKQSLITAGCVFLGSGALYLWMGAEFQQTYLTFPQAPLLPAPVLMVALGAAVTCALMALGQKRVVGLLVVGACVATSWSFNPLSSGFPAWQESEMGQAIQRVKRNESSAAAERSMWLTFGGGTFPGVASVAQVMGVRTLGGVHYHPQLDLWKPLDPKGENESKYNRFAHIRLIALPPERTDVIFQTPPYLGLHVFTSPVNPTLRQMGAKYIFTLGQVPALNNAGLRPIAGSLQSPFSIWQLPETPPP